MPERNDYLFALGVVTANAEKAAERLRTADRILDSMLTDPTADDVLSDAERVRLGALRTNIYNLHERLMNLDTSKDRIFEEEA